MTGQHLLASQGVNSLTLKKVCSRSFEQLCILLYIKFFKISQVILEFLEDIEVYRQKDKENSIW